jgi:hypothetical protein
VGGVNLLAAIPGGGGRGFASGVGDLNAGDGALLLDKFGDGFKRSGVCVRPDA